MRREPADVYIPRTGSDLVGGRNIAGDISEAKRTANEKDPLVHKSGSQIWPTYLPRPFQRNINRKDPVFKGRDEDYKQPQYHSPRTSVGFQIPIRLHYAVIDGIRCQAIAHDQ